MKRVICLVGSCLLSMLFILSVCCWLLDFTTNVALVVISFVLFAGLMVYTVYDVLNVVDDLNVYRGKYKRLKEKHCDLEENYDNACEEIKHLKDYIKEDSQEIARLRKLLHY